MAGVGDVWSRSTRRALREVMLAAAQATYESGRVVLCSTVLKSALGRTPGLPGPQTAIQTRPGMLLGATLGPKMAALPAEKHMANHRHVDGHAFLKYDIPPHAGRW